MLDRERTQGEINFMVGPRAAVTREGFLEEAELMQPLQVQQDGDGERAELFCRVAGREPPRKGSWTGSWTSEGCQSPFPGKICLRAFPSRAIGNGHPGLDHRKDFLPSD